MEAGNTVYVSPSSFTMLYFNIQECICKKPVELGIFFEKLEDCSIPANNIMFRRHPGNVALKFGLRCKSTSWVRSDGKFF